MAELILIGDIEWNALSAVPDLDQQLGGASKACGDAARQ